METPDPFGPIGLPPDCESLAEATVDADHHLVMSHGAARLRLCLRLAPTRKGSCLVIDCDACGTTRLAAATRFQRATRGRRAAPDRSAMPTGYQRARLTQLLALCDALDAGASTRDVAFGLVMPNHRPLAGPDWKGSGERRHVLRLIAEARRLVNGGYRKLLHHA